MSPTRELELKLEIRRGRLPALRSRALVQLGEAAASDRIVSTYFDTAGRHLRDAGLTLRIRSDGSRRVQTVKRAVGRPGVGTFDRSEWETELSGDEPDLAAAGGSLVSEAVADAPDGLRPVFRSEIGRTTWLVRRDGAAIEVALDDGRVTADAKSALFGEVELELKGGPPAALFGLARALDGTGAFRLGVLTKSERGYRLADGEGRPHRKAEPVGLVRGLATADALAAIVRACIRHFRLNEAAMVEGRAPEALHQARVAIRRLRSALSLFRDVLGDPETERVKVRLRDLAALLGAGRNLDVYLERLESDGAAGETLPPDRLAALRADRERAYDAIAKALASKRFRGLMLDLLIWAEDGAWRRPDDPDARERLDRPVEASAAKILRKRRRRVRKRGRDLDRLDAEARHRVRIEAKKLRYAAEFFSGLVERKADRKRLETFLSALEELQEALGTLNDLETARALRLEHGPAAPEETGGGEPDGKLVADAVAAHEAFVDAKPFWRGFA